ncbi:uncharacterized protein TrAtP1_010221 [Trichoderma atroviride]|uniref:uncharacterized protein n=1 Tax=Hypocrea atroviridis TaxID=63577 RepID=UPI00331DE4BD|nr:hypothetical protein TrAtP1_010221 [Trichoderma atroviride]
MPAGVFTPIVFSLSSIVSLSTILFVFFSVLCFLCSAPLFFFFVPFPSPPSSPLFPLQLSLYHHSTTLFVLQFLSIIQLQSFIKHLSFYLRTSPVTVRHNPSP